LPPRERFETIGGEDLYRMLALGTTVYLLDVRTPTEYDERHIPGSALIPLHELEQRIHELPNGGRPIAVICEQGIRSVSACRLLAEHDVTPLYNLEGGLDAWPGPMEQGREAHGHAVHPVAPSPFLIESFDLLPKGLALDVAMGEGRHAIYLATRGFDVDGVDADPRAVAQARAAARRLGAPIRAIVGNVEDGTYILPLETYDLIVVFNYLHRPLFHDIRDGVVPGGAVIYQTFTVGQKQFGSPTHPDHLLEPGELRRAFDGWEILRYHETTGPSRTTGRMRAVAGIVAKKPLD
jgi:tellurite methyltransferase